jgi:hypothetical protein
MQIRTAPAAQWIEIDIRAAAAVKLTAAMQDLFTVVHCPGGAACKAK